MKFETVTLDFDLELTTLDGEEIKLSPKIKMNSANINTIMQKWIKLEEVKEKSIELLAKQLEAVYDKKAEWWMDSFNPSTLKEVLVYVAETMGGVKKNDKT